MYIRDKSLLAVWRMYRKAERLYPGRLMEGLLHWSEPTIMM